MLILQKLVLFARKFRSKRIFGHGNHLVIDILKCVEVMKLTLNYLIHIRNYTMAIHTVSELNIQ